MYAGQGGGGAARNDIMRASQTNLAGDGFSELGASSGGSRLRDMMLKSEQRKQQQQRAATEGSMGSPLGDQKFFDLDEEENDDDKAET